MFNQLNRSNNLINKKLTENHYGWHFGYDEEYKSYFLSIFDPRNYREELFFLIDVQTNPGVKRGIRIRKDGEQIFLRKTNRFYIKAETLVEYIRTLSPVNVR